MSCSYRRLPIAGMTAAEASRTVFPLLGLARLLEAQVERLHGATFPGRFSWIIHRWWYGPLGGPVGSSLR